MAARTETPLPLADHDAVLPESLSTELDNEMLQELHDTILIPEGTAARCMAVLGIVLTKTPSQLDLRDKREMVDEIKMVHQAETNRVMGLLELADAADSSEKLERAQMQTIHSFMDKPYYDIEEAGDWRVDDLKKPTSQNLSRARRAYAFARTLSSAAIPLDAVSKLGPNFITNSSELPEADVTAVKEAAKASDNAILKAIGQIMEDDDRQTVRTNGILLLQMLAASPSSSSGGAPKPASPQNVLETFLKKQPKDSGAKEARDAFGKLTAQVSKLEAQLGAQIPKAGGAPAQKEGPFRIRFVRPEEPALMCRSFQHRVQKLEMVPAFPAGAFDSLTRDQANSLFGYIRKGVTATGDRRTSLQMSESLSAQISKRTRDWSSRNPAAGTSPALFADALGTWMAWCCSWAVSDDDVHRFTNVTHAVLWFESWAKGKLPPRLASDILRIDVDREDGSASDMECERWYRLTVASYIIFTGAFDLFDQASTPGFPANLNAAELSFLHDRVKVAARTIVAWWRDYFFFK